MEPTGYGPGLDRDRGLGYGDGMRNGDWLVGWDIVFTYRLYKYACPRCHVLFCRCELFVLDGVGTRE